MTRPGTIDRRVALLAPIHALGLLVPWSVAARASANDAAKVEEATREELDALWADLYGDDPAAAKAVIQLFKQADAAVPYLKEKLPPLKLNEADCWELLEDLGSEEESVWKAAWGKFDYLDPRLTVDLTTLMEDVVDVPARTRMVELLSQREADSLAGKNVNIRPVGDDGYNFFDGRASWWAEHRVDRIGRSNWQGKKAWTRAARCIAVLEQIGSPEAVQVLEQLAGGHPDAAPTRFAKESLERLAR